MYTYLPCLTSFRQGGVLPSPLPSPTSKRTPKKPTQIRVNENYTLKVSNIEIESKSSVKLLGVEIDNKLLFDKHIASLCKKHPISHMQYTDHKIK